MLLELKNIVKRYPTVGSAPPAAVLDGIDLTVASGQRLAIVGPSGSGKSTLLNVIGSLDRPSSGQVLLEGEDLGACDDRQLASIRNHRIGFIFQAHHLLPQCTVLENVLLPTLAGRRKSDDPSVGQRAEQLLDRVGLADRMDYRPDQLSVGQRQRVAVVRALIHQPPLLLADEPTGALDHTNAVNLIDLLIELNRQFGVALVVVTHATSLVDGFERVMTLHDGKSHAGVSRP